MRGRVFLFVLIAQLLCLGAAPAPEVKAKALAWLNQIAANATEERAAAVADLAKANAAIKLSQKAVALSHEQQDDGLEARSAAALASAEAERARAQARIDKADATLNKMKQVMADAVPGATGFALSMKGTATIITNGVSKPWNGSPAALSPGDTIAVSPGGRMVLAFDDGHEVTLYDNTVLNIVAKPKADPNAPLLERAMGYLQQGVMRINRKAAPKLTHPAIIGVLGQVDYRTPTAVAAVRGTDFQLKTDGSNQPTRFVPLSGEVEIGADAAGLKGYVAKAWWPAAPASFAKPSKGLVVLALTGKASVERAGAKLPLVAGNTVGTGDHVLVEAQGGVLLASAGGHRIAVGGASRFDVGEDKASKGALYVLREGRLHVWGDGSKSSARFLTPNSIAAGSPKEFEVSIGAGGTAEYLPLEGAMTVTAVANRLDWSKLPELAD